MESEELMDMINEILSRAPYHKQCVPSGSPDRYVYRKSLIDHISADGKRGKTVVIEARAGQGKSTLAAQFVQGLAKPTAWYQLGPEDRDPYGLLYGFASSLLRALPSAWDSGVLRILAAGDFSPEEIPHLFHRLLIELGEGLEEDLWLVIDDLHFLQHDPAAKALFSGLLEQASPRLHLLLLTRPPYPFEELTRGAKREVTRIDDQMLSFSFDEIFELFHNYLQMPLTHRDVVKLYETTEGWITGLLLQGYAKKGEESRDCGGTAFAQEEGGPSEGSLVQFFRKNIVSRLSPAARHALLRLCLLESIPASFAGQVAQADDFDRVLERMALDNNFIRRLGGDAVEYSLHHLFRDALRSMASIELSRHETQTLYLQAGAYYLEKGCEDEALDYLLRGGDFCGADRLLQRKGHLFFQASRMAKLGRFLDAAPPRDLERFGWLSYFTGLARLNSNPSEAYSFFETARERFAEKGEDVGEFLAGLEVLCFYSFIELNYSAGSVLLEELDRTFDAIRPELDGRRLVEAAINMAIGFEFIPFDLPRAWRYLEIAAETAKDLGQENIDARLCFARGYAGVFGGRLEVCEEEFEKAIDHIGSRQVTGFNKALLLAMISNYYVLCADQKNYERYYRELERHCDLEMRTRTSIEAWQAICRADLALSRGMNGAALAALKQGTEEGFAVDLPHLRSQFMQYRALVLALLGIGEGIIELAEESYELRCAAGGNFFRLWNALLVGATLALLGRRREGEAYLDQAVSLAAQLDHVAMHAGACALRSFARLTSGTEGGREDLSRALSLMKRIGQTHFFGCAPPILRVLLGEAVRNGIETDYARRLAAERLSAGITSEGELFGLLNITALGSLQIELPGEARMTEADLTPIQRAFLAELIVAPGNRLLQEVVQERLWPEGDPEKSRKSFDVLLVRLRKKFAQVFGKEAARRYLAVRKGFVFLEHCRIDAVEFEALAAEGLTLVRKGKYWQAGNLLYRACSLWGGPLLPNIFTSEAVDAYRVCLNERFRNASLQWGRYLQRWGDSVESLSVLERAYETCRADPMIAGELYRGYMESGDLAAGRSLLSAIAADMEKEGFLPGEIGESLDAVRKGACPAA